VSSHVNVFAALCKKVSEHGIETDAAGIGILASNISVKYQTVWYRTDQMLAKV